MFYNYTLANTTCRFRNIKPTNFGFLSARKWHSFRHWAGHVCVKWPHQVNYCDWFRLEITPRELNKIVQHKSVLTRSSCIPRRPTLIIYVYVLVPKTDKKGAEPDNLLAGRRHLLVASSLQKYICHRRSRKELATGNEFTLQPCADYVDSNDARHKNSHMTYNVT